MAKAVENPSPAEKRQSKREQAKRAAARRATAFRRVRILEKLAAGISVPRIALAENCSVRRVRQIIVEMLEAREIDPPAGYAQLQIARLNDAMMVTHVKMMAGDLDGVDRMVKLVRELDRYHGFGCAPAGPALAPPPPAPLQIAAAPRALCAPQPSPEEADRAEIFPLAKA